MARNLFQLSILRELTYNNHHHVKYIPNRSNVFHSMLTNLQRFLDDVVDDKGNKDELARHDEVIPGFNVL